MRNHLSLNVRLDRSMAVVMQQIPRALFARYFKGSFCSKITVRVRTVFDFLGADSDPETQPYAPPVYRIICKRDYCGLPARI
jgi:hypothetical protein